MNFTLLRSWWTSRTRCEKAAFIVWTAVLLVVCVRVFIAPDKRTVYPIFSGSAQLWWSGLDLYEPHRPDTVQGGYRYSPTFAILVSPFAVFPDSLGGILWRLVSSGALLCSLAWLARTVLPWSFSRDQFALLMLFCLPLTVQSLSNGQANIIVIAAMLASVAAVREQRWNVSCILMTLAFICKVYPLALGMLLIMLYPRQLFARMTCAIALSLALPFLMQETNYVVDQNDKWFTLLRADDRTEAAPDDKHRDLRLLLEICGMPLSKPMWGLVQLAGGAGIALLTWLRQLNGWPEKSLLTATLALAATWMVALGPVVESSTFVLLAPALAWSILTAVQDDVSMHRKLLLVGSVMMFVLAVLLGGIANTARLHVIGLHPAGSLLYLLFLLTERRPPAPALSPSLTYRAAA